MGTRESGFYWALLNTEPDHRWAVAEWTGSMWLVTGEETPRDDSGVLDTGERLTLTASHAFVPQYGYGCKICGIDFYSHPGLENDG